MIALASNRMPNFAGVALVDILANGVAVLIIVVVLSIAEREEQEKELSERVKEVSAVMTREFSTSLVLNRLAASSPARLHDYENSDLDQFWDPYLLPIIEFHNDSARDPYSGKIWTRSELLEKPNSFDDFLSAMTLDQKQRFRGDIYDVGSYYLVNSILSDYQIQIRHWHFMGSMPGQGSVLRCPPDVLARDCLSVGTNDSVVTAEELGDLLGQQAEGNGEGGGFTDEDSAWPPEGLEGVPDFERGRGEIMPEGATLGSQAPGDLSDGLWGSFPDASMANSTGSPNGQGGTGGGQPSDNSIRFRLADPRQLDQNENAIQLDFGDPSIAQLLAGLMAYLSELQRAYDSNLNLEPLLANFALILNGAVTNPPQLTEAQSQVVEDLSLILSSADQFGDTIFEPILLSTYEDLGAEQAILKVTPNRLIFSAQTNTKNQSWAAGIPSEGSPKLNINGYPGIWRGLQVTLYRGAVLMIVPGQTQTNISKWRAVTYVAPELDDFIVGFIYSSLDESGQLAVLGESNQVRVESVSLSQPLSPATFGVKTWLVVFYCLLGISFVGLLLFWRPHLKIAR